MPMDSADLSVSEQAHATMPARLAARTEVLVHGIDLDATRALADRDAARRDLGIGSAEIVFGTVANFRAQKDYPNLLAAARALLDRNVPVRFLVVGQGPLDAEIRAERTRLGLETTVTILGERHDAIRVMSACDGFVLASNNEGLPVALMEALAIGLPVVATDVGGVAEAITDGVNGRLVPTRNPIALADALQSLVDDPERRAALAAGAAASSGRFDIRRTVARIATVYRSLANQESARG